MGNVPNLTVSFVWFYARSKPSSLDQMRNAKGVFTQTSTGCVTVSTVTPKIHDSISCLIEKHPLREDPEQILLAAYVVAHNTVLGIDKKNGLRFGVSRLYGVFSGNATGMPIIAKWDVWSQEIQEHPPIKIF